MTRCLFWRDVVVCLSFTNFCDCRPSVDPNLPTAPSSIGLLLSLSSLLFSSLLFSSLLFSSGQTTVKLSGAEAADRAQCAAPDKPVGYWNLLVAFANPKRVIQCACFKSLGSRKGTPKCNLRILADISCSTAFTKKMKTCFLLFLAERT